MSVKAQRQGVLAVEGASEVARSALRLHNGFALAVAGNDAGLAPSGIADLEVVTALDVDVEHIGVAMPTHGVVIQCSPVVHGAAKEQLAVAEWTFGLAIAHTELRLLAFWKAEMKAHRSARKLMLNRGAAGLQVGRNAPREADRATPVSVRRPVVIGHLELVLALGRSNEFVVVAAPAHAPVFLGVPAVETAAHKNVSVGQGGAGAGISGLGHAVALVAGDGAHHFGQAAEPFCLRLNLNGGGQKTGGDKQWPKQIHGAGSRYGLDALRHRGRVGAYGS